MKVSKCQLRVRSSFHARRTKGLTKADSSERHNVINLPTQTQGDICCVRFENKAEIQVLSLCKAFGQPQGKRD